MMPDWGPSLASLLTGPAFAGTIIAWWRHAERRRRQTDEVALDLVRQQAARIDMLEGWVRDLQHELRNALTERDGLYWLLKYCPEERRTAAVDDVDRQRSDRRLSPGPRKPPRGAPITP